MTDHSNSIEAAPIKRATRACLSCRAKKIRCDVEEQGQPCSNCLFDEDQCQVTSSKRGRKPGRRLKKSPKRAKTALDTSEGAGPVDSAVDGLKETTVPLSRVSPTHTAGWLDSGGGMDMLSQHHDEGTPPRRSAPELDPRFLHQALTYVSLIDRKGDLSTMHTNLTPMSLPSPPQTSPSTSAGVNHNSLPNVFTPLSHSIGPEDVDYLRLKGTLDIPSTSFLTALFGAYVQFVYPFMPTVDLSSIQRTLAGEDASISVLLFQAILFAAVPFVDLNEILRAGFDSRRHCRKAFYNKAKLLYDLDVDSDKLTAIQATLLMAYWNEDPGDNKGAWHWTGVAISLAQTLGMHRKAEYKVQSHEHRLYKRIWWSCYIRDRLLAVAMCRPLRIRDAEFNTPPLTLEDFDILDSDVETGDVVLSTDTQKVLAELYIGVTELCKLIAGVLELHFSIFPSEDSTAPRDNGTNSTMLYLKNSLPEEQLVEECDKQLQNWYNNLPASCVYRTRSQDGTGPCVIVNAASLHVTFWAVVSALHRPHVRSRDREVSVRRVKEAAIEVSRVDQEMHEACLDQYLPATVGIAFQFSAFLTHTRCLEHQKTYGITETLISLFFCIKVIETLRESFVGGDAGIWFVRSVAQQVGVTLVFDPDSKLCGIEHRGFHYSPVVGQLSLDSHACVADGFADVSPHRVAYESAYGSGLPMNGDVANENDPELPSFDNINAIDWDSLTDMLPVFDTAFEQSFGRLINVDYF